MSLYRIIHVDNMFKIRFEIRYVELISIIDLVLTIPVTIPKHPKILVLNNYFFTNEIEAEYSFSEDSNKV